MNEEKTEKCLRQLEHIRGHLRHRYSIAVNQVKSNNFVWTSCTVELFSSLYSRFPCINTFIIYKLEINVFNETNVGKNRLTILALGNIGHKTQKEDKKKNKKKKQQHYTEN